MPCAHNILTVSNHLESPFRAYLSKVLVSWVADDLKISEA
jgi:hypothetical protein